MGNSWEGVLAEWKSYRVGALSGVKPENSQLGKIVANAAQLEQSIMILLLTPRGTVAHDPEFGSEIFTYISKPINHVRNFLRREIFETLRQEERIICNSVKVSSGGSQQPELVKFSIDWIVRQSGRKFNTSFALRTTS